MGKAGAGTAASVIDVGGGQSTLARDLLAAGYRDVTVLDISEAALAGARTELGADADRIHWIAGDVTEAPLPAATYDIWHDRAVFHFLVSPSQREAYTRQAARALKTGGHLILSAFALNGPERCSGLDVVRYSAASLGAELGAGFRLVESVEERHRTPGGGEQPFVYCLFELA